MLRAFLYLAALPALAQFQTLTDLSLDRIEAVQVTQVDAHSVPLIADKTAVVRVFVRQSARLDPPISGVSASLRGFRNGRELPEGPLRPMNATITAQAAPDRASESHSLNFLLPLSWTAAGALELRAAIVLPAGVNEFPTTNNSLTRTVNFEPGAAVRVIAVPLCVNFECPPPSVQDTGNLLDRFLPAGAWSYEELPVPPIAVEGDALIERWNAVLSGLPARFVYWLPGGASGEYALLRNLAAGIANPGPAGEPGFDTLTRRLTPPATLDITSDDAAGAYWLSPATYIALRTALVTPPARSPFSVEPGGIAFIAPAEGAVVDGTLTLSWTPAGGATYKLYYSIDRQTWIPFAIDVPSTEYALDTVYLAPAQQMWFAVTTTDGGAAGIAGPFDVAQHAAISAPASLDLGSASVGNAQERVLAIANTGASRLLIESLAIDNSEFFLLGPALPATIRPGTQRRFTLRFQPRLPGERSAKLALRTNDPNQPEATVELHATSYDRAIANIEVSANTLDFGESPAGIARELPVMVRNTGNATLNVTSMLTRNSRFSAPSPAAPFSIAPNAEREITVRFAPNAVGRETGELIITSNDPSRATVMIGLSGTGIQALLPVISASPATLDFGNVFAGQTRDVQLTLRNTGNAVLAVTRAASSNPRFQATTELPLEIQPGASAPIVIRFSPTAAGPQNGQLTIASNDPVRPALAVPLLGNGVAAGTVLTPRILSLSPATVNRNGRAFTLSVFGANFSAASLVEWNGSARPTTLVNPEQIEAAIPATDLAAEGAAAITVRTPGDGGGVSASLKVLINPSAGANVSIHQFELGACPRVNMIVSVADANGLGLPAITFACTENGATVGCANPQPAAATNRGLYVVGILDSSAPFADVQGELTAMRALADAIGLEDRLMFLQADNGVRTLPVISDFVLGENKGAFKDALAAVRAPLGTATAVYDAVNEAVRRLKATRAPRGAIVLISSNVNTYGSSDRVAFFNGLRAGGYPVFTLPTQSARAKPQVLDLLNQISLETGGVMFADATVLDSTSLQRLTNRLAAQTLLGFDTAAADGVAKTVEVTLPVFGATRTTLRSYPGCR